MAARAAGLSLWIVLLAVAGIAPVSIDADEHPVPMWKVDPHGRIALEVPANEPRMLDLLADEPFQVAHMHTDASTSPYGLKGQMLIALFPKDHIAENLGTCEFVWPHWTWTLLPHPAADLEPVAAYPPAGTNHNDDWTYPPGEYTLLVAATEDNLALIAFGDPDTAAAEWWINSGYMVKPTGPATVDVAIVRDQEPPMVREGLDFEVRMRAETEVSGPGVVLAQHEIRPAAATGLPGLRPHGANGSCVWADISSTPTVSTPLAGAGVYTHLGMFYPTGGSVTWGAVYSAPAGVWHEPTGSSRSDGAAAIVTPKTG